MFSPPESAVVEAQIAHVAIHGHAWLPFLQPDQNPLFLRDGVGALAPADRATLLHELAHTVLQAGTISVAFIGLVAHDLWSLCALQLMGDTLAVLPPETRSTVARAWYGEQHERVLAFLADNAVLPERREYRIFELWRSYAPEQRLIAVALAANIAWLQEGLALVTELDWLPAAKIANHMSLWYEFFIALAWQTIRNRSLWSSDITGAAAGIAGISTHWRRFGLPLPERGVTWPQLFDVLATPLTTDERRHRLWCLLNPVEGVPDHAFAGYLLLRGIQQRLAEKDARLANAEVFLTFLLGYFRYDEGFLDYLVPPSAYYGQAPPQPLDWIATSITQKSLRTLLAVAPDRLHTLVDAIEIPEESPHDFHQLHVAAGVAGKPLAHASWDQWGETIIRLLNMQIDFSIEGLKAAMPPAQMQTMLEQAEAYREKLVSLCYQHVNASLLFPFLKTECQLIGFKESDARLFFVWHYPALDKGEVTVEAPTVVAGPEETDYTVLDKVELAVETYALTDTQARDWLSHFTSIGQPVPNLGEINEVDLTRDMGVPPVVLLAALASGCHRTCQEQQFFYLPMRRLLIARQHAEHIDLRWVRPESTPIGAPDDAQQLDPMIRGLPQHEKQLDVYVKWIMRLAKDGDCPAPSPNAWLESLIAIWREIHPAATATPQQLRRFFNERLHFITGEPAAWHLLLTLAEEGSHLWPIGSPEHQALARANERWCRMTGQPFILLESAPNDLVLARWQL